MNDLFLNILTNKEFIQSQSHTFGTFYLPFLAAAKQEYLQALSSNIHSENTDTLFCPGMPELILSRLHAVCVRTLIVEMSMYKAAGKLEGNNSSEEYQFFAERILGKEELREELFEVYPLLAENIGRTVHQSAAFLSEMRNRLEADRKEIEKNILHGRPMGNITGIQDMAADCHCGGKCVLKIKTDRGDTFLYKPRNAQTEKAFLNLLNYFYEGIQLDSFTYGMVLREKYAWVAWVSPQECTQPPQAERYYRRLGVCIFLSFLLGTGDLHYENLIAHGEYPVPVDTEVLCTAAGGEKDIVGNDDPDNVDVGKDTAGKDAAGNYHVENYSVLYSGILPDPARQTHVNVLNAGAGEKAAIKVARVINDKTSDMKIAYENPQMHAGKNQVVLNGNRISPAAYKAAIISGFQEACLMFLKDKNKVLQKIMEEIRGCRVRVLLDNTQRYATLLSGSSHPMILQKEENQRKLFENLYAGMAALAGVEKQAVEYGIRDLQEGDIPYYFTRPDSHALFASKGEKMPGYFRISFIDCIRNRAEKLCREELERQEQIIGLSMDLSGYTKADFVNSYVPLAGETAADGDRERRFYEIALKAAKQIEQAAIWDEKREHVTWMEPVLAGVKEEGIRLLQGDCYLYNGTAGIAVFLHAVNKVSGKQGELCRAVRNTLFQYTDRCLEDRRRLASGSTGAFCGEASICYAYQAMYRITEDAVFLEYAEKHSRLLPELIEKDTAFDLVYGNAGAVLVLCGLYELTSSEAYLRLARRAADILIANVQKQEKGAGWQNRASQAALAGMSHGGSGFLPGLAKLGCLLKSEEYEPVLLEVLAYERSLYSEAWQNWADLRQEEGKERWQAGAWCHGFGGVAAARLACLPYVNGRLKELMEEDLRLAEHGFLMPRRRKGMCLCHGNMGMLLLLESYGKKFPSERLAQVKNALSGAALEELEKGRLMPQEKYAKGLMSGMSGIGYACLKLAGVASLPDILVCGI
ncbi:type 2 lanthipeptide synthetase LanM [Eisenbergiella sp.]